MAIRPRSFESIRPTLEPTAPGTIPLPTAPQPTPAPPQIATGGARTPTPTAPAAQPVTTPPVNAVAPSAPPPAAFATPTPAPPQLTLPDIRGQFIGPGDANDTAGLRGQVGDAIQRLFSAPDRSALAQQLSQAFNERSQEQLSTRVRDIGRDAAKFGRIGSGVTTSNVGDAFRAAEDDRARFETELAATTAGQELGDRAGILQSLLGVQGQFAGQDARAREELRGERGVAEGLAQSDLQNRIQQRLLEEQLLDADFNRNLRQGQAAGAFGFSSDPTRAFQGAAGQEFDFGQGLIRSGSGAFGAQGAANATGGFDPLDFIKRLLPSGSGPLAATGPGGVNFDDYIPR